MRISESWRKKLPLVGFFSESFFFDQSQRSPLINMHRLLTIFALIIVPTVIHGAVWVVPQSGLYIYATNQSCLTAYGICMCTIRLFANVFKLTQCLFGSNASQIM